MLNKYNLLSKCERVINKMWAMLNKNNSQTKSETVIN